MLMGRSHDFLKIISIICSPTDEILALFFLGSVMFASPVSGAHVNPAVTLAMLLAGKVNFGLAILYWLA